MKWDKISQDFDRLAALAGVPLFTALIVYGLVGLYNASPANNVYYVIFGAVAFFSCVIWLRIRNASLIKDLSFPSHPRLFLLGNSLFFFFFGCAILALHLRSEVYVRPPPYFFFAALAVTAIALEILACDSQTKSLALILGEIMLAGFLLQISQLILFPNVVGIDPWAHEQFTVQILQLGHIPTPSQYLSAYTYQYGGLPLFHLRVASTSLLSGLDYKWSAILSVGVGLVIIGTLFVFLLGKSLLNAKAGLLGALILVTADFFIWAGFWTIPNTLGAILLLIGVYLLLKTPLQNPVGDLTVMAIIFVALIMTHTISAIAMVLISFSGLVASLVYVRLYQRPVTISLSFAKATIFTAAMLAWWAYATNTFDVLRGFIALSTYEAFSQVTAVYVSGIPLLQQALSAVGESVYFAVLTTGFFYVISRGFDNAKAFILVFMGAIPFVIGYSRAFGLFLVPERWVFFAQILYAVPLALAVLILCSLFRDIKARSLFLAATVLVLALLMILGPVANIDQNLSGSATWERFSLTGSELTAINTTAHKSGSEIISDAYYASASSHFFHADVVAHQNNTTNVSNAIFFIRAAEGGAANFSVDSLYYPFSFTPFNVYTPGDWNTTELGSRIYDSRSVTGYENSYTTYRSLLGAQ